MKEPRMKHGLNTERRMEVRLLNLCFIRVPSVAKNSFRTLNASFPPAGKFTKA